MTDKAAYDVFVNTRQLGILKAAQAILVEEGGALTQFGFRYLPEYLERPDAFSLDPVQLPLLQQEFTLDCRQGVPGILDDYLPDDWGRKVLAQLAFYRDKQRINHHSCIDTLSVIGNSRIGALSWIPKDSYQIKQANNTSDLYGIGCSTEEIAVAEHAAQIVDDPEQYPDKVDEMSLLYLANAGTGVGGARPKALVHSDEQAYLAKFNRLSYDQYNNARVELACLKMAKQAGLNIYDGHIQHGINGREVLLLKRFDVEQSEYREKPNRRHLITVNALLKEPSNQRDKGGVFRYDDIVTLIRQYSCAPEQDLEQLLRMMLFNRSINNTDTHERNFSFVYSTDGYQLSPAYDMVPSLTVGQYAVAGYQYSPQPPLCSEVQRMGKIFGLPKTQVKTIAEQVADAVECWVAHADSCGVSDQDADIVGKIIRL